MSGVTINTQIFNIYIDMDLDKTLTSEARIVLFAVSKQKTLRVLSCVEVSIIHNGGQSQAREALLSEAA